MLPVDLFQLMEFSDMDQNLCLSLVIFISEVCELLRKSNTSSTYGLIIGSVFSGWTPLISTFYLIAPANGSIKITKSKGESGQHCLVPCKVDACKAQKSTLEEACNSLHHRQAVQVLHSDKGDFWFLLISWSILDCIKHNRIQSHLLMAIILKNVSENSLTFKMTHSKLKEEQSLSSVSFGANHFTRQSNKPLLFMLLYVKGIHAVLFPLPFPSLAVSLCLSLKCPCWGFYLLVPFEAVASLCLHYLVICEGLHSGAHTVHPVA